MNKKLTNPEKERVAYLKSQAYSRELTRDEYEELNDILYSLREEDNDYPEKTLNLAATSPEKRNFNTNREEQMHEIEECRQVPGEGFRRWFIDSYFELIVWYESSEISGFQLCYGGLENQKAITVTTNTLSHTCIDEGDRDWMNASPVLERDGGRIPPALPDKFKRHSQDLEPDLAGYVYSQLKAII